MVALAVRLTGLRRDLAGRLHESALGGVDAALLPADAVVAGVLVAGFAQDDVRSASAGIGLGFAFPSCDAAPCAAKGRVDRFAAVEALPFWSHPTVPFALGVGMWVECTLRD